ncbi:hypothetical protein IWW34DRAFT_798345 [Fusarium oxysporum f. sp. albedinis]|uniref:Uncharacterized protein n=1 Tax=Fusarium oxysporum (strain Fo5176) TaxID=660025 RepID=F9FK89_FUSOF|nr:hypothetical protein FOXB_06818 [Fusarium oxysporum f. sp. conglutinans Fo5176]KAI3588406.1 hypothetical protein IWW34DRAFT_798345 [Fusarium oxysporum f. sp. albedinis]
MWQVVPGDPEVRRERVRPGEWDLEKEAEKPGQRIWRIGRAGVRSAQVDSGQERFDLSREHSNIKEKRIQSVRESSWPTNGPTEALFSNPRDSKTENMQPRHIA